VKNRRLWWARGEDVIDKPAHSMEVNVQVRVFVRWGGSCIHMTMCG
jgi:hypothetical protein